jgi:sterol desaturase/sphingolipid hydroxylase (fatty acid hydroxylase superfamily)
VLRESRRTRWTRNLSLVAIDVLVQRFTLGAAAFAAAVYAQAHGWGLLAVLDWPWWAKAAAGFLFLDLAIYLQHVLSHALPAFWRVHRVHHADLDLDATSGLRFHPVEILLSLVYKVLLVTAMGVDPWVVVAFEATLNAAAIFTHANIKMPAALDRVLRWFVCTPDMHRVHHSVVPRETNSNFGFFLSVWDRLFGTMRDAPEAGHEGVVLGLPDLQTPKQVGLGALLLLPLRKDPPDA